ncbi:Pyridoxal 4-dehydrogenase [Ensifer psoraleae]|uniref:SDR family oxidoreductase n=1 Tax=Sinorhizobium psoraleae TaxID=520838 RepID=UPI00156820F4|nr:SDR family oxidoreductase [Sinorhizobium psoraleae]NRP72166.1 Pyridoxal 4-dehydrogenase [Sinorhizobium psoraleae]
MDLGLKGTRVMITAAAGGIGLEIARAFLAEGAAVHVCDLNEEALTSMRRDIPGQLTTSVCDVSSREAVERFFSEGMAALGGLDCLVNNAGIAGPTGGVDEIDPADWQKTIDVNTTGQFNCIRLAVPELKKSDNASIINLSSAAGRLGFAMRTPYAASKWAVVGFTKSLSIELGPYGIRVNAILPGITAGARQDAVLSEKARRKGITLEEMREIALDRASIKAFVSPRQIADTIVCLASKRFATTSGQVINIDGDLQMLS